MTRQKCNNRMLKNHDDDDKTSQICIFYNDINSFARFAREILIAVHFVDVVKLSVLQLCGRREHMMTNAQFSVQLQSYLLKLPNQRSFHRRSQRNSSKWKTHAQSFQTMHAPHVLAERAEIIVFLIKYANLWLPRCCRHCESCLLSDPKRATGFNQWLMLFCVIPSSVTQWRFVYNLFFPLYFWRFVAFASTVSSTGRARLTQV